MIFVRSGMASALSHEALNYTNIPQHIIRELIGSAMLIEKYSLVKFTPAENVKAYLQAGAHPDSPVITLWKSFPQDEQWCAASPDQLQPNDTINFMIDWKIAERLGIYSSNVIPAPPEILLNWPKYTPQWITAGGSVLYTQGLVSTREGKRRDFDFATVLELDSDPLRRFDCDLKRTSHHGPCIRFYTTSSWLDALRRGERLAWEILTAPKEMTVANTLSLNGTTNRVLEKLHAQVQAHGHRDLLVKSSWRTMSEAYFARWWPIVRNGPHSSPDDSLRSYAIGSYSKGGIHKGHYYLLLDAILSSWAEEHDCFSATAPFGNLGIALTLYSCKSGEMTFDEWVDAMGQYAPTCVDIIKKESGTCST